MRGFAVQEAIIQTVEAAVKAYGLQSLKGSDGEVEVLEDIPQVAKQYKAGDPVQFTATFNAMYDPEQKQQQQQSSSSEETEVVDAEVVE